jgi:hypothetical protein
MEDAPTNRRQETRQEGSNTIDGVSPAVYVHYVVSIVAGKHWVQSVCSFEAHQLQLTFSSIAVL